MRIGMLYSVLSFPYVLLFYTKRRTHSDSILPDRWQASLLLVRYCAYAMDHTLA